MVGTSGTDYRSLYQKFLKMGSLYKNLEVLTLNKIWRQALSEGSHSEVCQNTYYDSSSWVAISFLWLDLWCNIGMFIWMQKFLDWRPSWSSIKYHHEAYMKIGWKLSLAFKTRSHKDRKRVFKPFIKDPNWLDFERCWQQPHGVQIYYVSYLDKEKNLGLKIFQS